MKRYYPRFDGKEGLEERYVVVDATTREPVSAPMTYHEANNQAHARNEGTFTPPVLDASLVALPIVAPEALEEFVKAWSVASMARARLNLRYVDDTYFETVLK